MDLLNTKSFKDYLKKTRSAQSTLRSGVNQKSTGRKQIKKAKLESGMNYRKIVPLQFTVPFNPFDPLDETYHGDNLFQFEGSATLGMSAFKMMLKEAVDNEDEVFINKVSETMGIEPDNFDWESGAITEDEMKLVWSWRRPLVYVGKVVATQFSDRKAPYPQIRGVDVMFDEDGEPVEDPSNDISLTLWRYETDALIIEVETLEKTFEPGGRNSHLTEKQKKDLRSQLWKDRLISKPFLKYALRYLEIPYNKQDDTPTSESMKLIDGNNLWELERIKLCGRPLIDSLIGDIGSRKDVAPDYLEYMVQNPVIPKDKEKQKGQFAKDVQTTIAGSDDRMINFEGCQDFYEKYRQYRDTLEYFTEKIIKSSLYEFTPMTSEDMIAKFCNDITKYENAMRDPEIQKLFQNAQLSTASELMKEITSGFEDTSDMSRIKEVASADKQDITVLKDGDTDDIKAYGNELSGLEDFVSAEPENVAAEEGGAGLAQMAASLAAKTAAPAVASAGVPDPAVAAAAGVSDPAVAPPVVSAGVAAPAVESAPSEFGGTAENFADLGDLGDLGDDEGDLFGSGV